MSLFYLLILLREHSLEHPILFAQGFTAFTMLVATVEENGSQNSGRGLEFGNASKR
ncbi:MAG: hypothetical protein ACKO2P_15585 [Planctomycetota bacterium]